VTFEAASLNLYLTVCKHTAADRMEDPETVAPKRKASPDHDYERNECPHQSAKRARQDVSPDPRDRKAQSPPAHRRESHSRMNYDEPERRTSASASVEEKKRGKRLFGGLLTTLNQTNTNPLQKRRQEIEKRQMERQERQKEEDTQKRDENIARIQEIREREQIAFEEKVMRHKHSKMMWVAQHLETRATPPIYYSPWKLTKRQEDVIDTQIREAKDKIQHERESFEQKTQQRPEDHTHSRLSSPPAAGNETVADAPHVTHEAEPTQSA
jgi:hypothetical protein